MSKGYTTLQKAEDAKKFAESEFGQHYIKRIKRLKADALSVSMNLNYTDSQRAHMATQAAVYEQEASYFKIAQSLQENESFMSKLKAKLKAKGGDQTEV